MFANETRVSGAVHTMESGMDNLYTIVVGRAARGKGDAKPARHSRWEAAWGDKPSSDYEKRLCMQRGLEEIDGRSEGRGFADVSEAQGSTSG